MRSMFLLAAVVLFVAGCSVGGDSPTDPFESATTVSLSHIGEDPELCGGFSPCDAFDYRDDDNTGIPGMCFLPPTVDNHLSDEACSGDFLSGIDDGVFELLICEATYDVLDGTVPPAINCDQSDRRPLVENASAEFYSTSVRFGRLNRGKVFRLYVVHGDVHYAHRDVIVDPNETTPADGFVHSIGFGNEPIKLRITEGLRCLTDDESGGTSCLVAGAVSFGFETGDLRVTFNFPDNNPTFFADFAVSECLSLGFDFEGTTPTGNALVDVPLADCKISLDSELAVLTEPGTIEVQISDSRWNDGGEVFASARLNLLQFDGAGVAVLPPSPPGPNWFGSATSDSFVFRWIGKGLGRLAALFRPKPLYAEIGVGEGWDFTRMSDFQLAVMPVMAHDMAGTACGSGLASCLDLGALPGSGSVPVTVKVEAPDNTAQRDYPAGHFPVPDTRLHFFPANGSTVDCPTGSEGPIPPYGRGCYAMGVDDESTDPASTWDHLVVITGSDGTGSVDWNLVGGANTLNVSACGVARPGTIEPSPSAEPGADGVWGVLGGASGNCTNRAFGMVATDANAFDNGPADGFTPFEPVNTVNEVAIYGRPLTFEAQTCPTIVVDGFKGGPGGTVAEWEDGCVDKEGFVVSTRGPKPTEDNAWIYTYNDGNTLFVALEVETNDLGDKIFMNLVETFDGTDFVPASGDDLLVFKFDDPDAPLDWYFTDFCLGNNSSSLCGDADMDPSGLDGTGDVEAGATLGGAGDETVFYEFSRPLGSANSTPAEGIQKEDFAGIPGNQYGLRITVTQGQGGGKGGFVIPDSKAGKAYHPFTIR